MNRYLNFKRATTVVALMSLAACSQLPPLPETRAETIERFRQAPPDRSAQAMPDAAHQTPVAWPWWTVLNEPVLDDLQTRLLLDSPSLQVLAAQTRQAQAALAAAQASLWPSLNLNTGVTRSANQLAAVQGTSFNVSTPLSWEIDLWGRLDAQAQTALANLEALRNDWQAGRRAAQSTLVRIYLGWRTAERQIDALRRAEQAYERAHELTLARQQAGVAAATDVALAQIQWHNARAQRIELITQREQLQHAIATLLGQTPAHLELPALPALSALPVGQLANWPATPPELPANIPANLLEQRPDLQAAKKRVEAANAQLGVTQAAFFPTVNFTLAAGYRARELGNWLTAGNQFWSVGPSAALNLLDFGQRRAARDMALAARDLALANYRQSVLTAYQEVEDNLVAAVQLQQQEMAQNQAWQAARHNLELTQAQFLAGTVSYLNVVLAQNSALSAERAWLDVQSRRWLALNNLMAAGLRF